MYIQKMVKDEQMIVQFHIDDLQVLYKDQAMLDDFLDKLRSDFGKENELMENKGLTFEYLGISID